MPRRFIAILLSLSVLLLVVFGFGGLAAMGRYFDDACVGPDPFTSDCEDAYFVMWLGGIGSVFAAVATGTCVALLLRSR